jgi:hypothetical protein
MTGTPNLASLTSYREPRQGQRDDRHAWKKGRRSNHLRPRPHTSAVSQLVLFRRKNLPQRDRNLVMTRPVEIRRQGN